MSKLLKTTLWGVKVPVAYFDAGARPPLDHPDRIKQDWVLVVSRCPHVQSAIERDIPYRRSKPHAMYSRLIDNPSLVFDVTYRIDHKDDMIAARILSYRARPKGRQLNA